MTFSLHICHTCSGLVARQGKSAVVSESLPLPLQRIKKLKPAIDEVHGKLEVLLVSAKGLEDTDFLNNMDPFVILTCRTQEQKSSVANGAGSEPEWNETFIFTVSDETPQLHLKIMDSDLTNDDFVGEATIPLEAVFQEGSLPPAVHPVVKEEKYCGEIKLALTFTPAVETRRPDDSSWS